VSDPGVDQSIVELWWTSVGDRAPPSADLIALLDGDEVHRADRFRVADARRRFVGARAMLRCLLGRRLGVPPRDLRLTTGPRGKPSVGPGDTTVHFNLSHSADLVVVAIASSEVGVDVETLRPVPRAERLAARFFAESERRWLVDLPSEELERSFLRVWTCKEAYLKAIGSGIGVPLSRVEVDPERPAVIAAPNDPDVPSRWTLLRAELPSPAVCAVAVRGHGWQLAVREFDWQSLQSITLNVER
jgi:4'-phosphopantetheinyl transferase